MMLAHVATCLFARTRVVVCIVQIMFCALDMGKTSITPCITYKIPKYARSFNLSRCHRPKLGQLMFIAQPYTVQIHKLSYYSSRGDT